MKIQLFHDRESRRPSGKVAMIAAILLTMSASSFGQAVPSAVATSPRETISFDRAWKFHLGEAPDAKQPGFDDASWRKLDVPHDWMIEGVPGADPSSMEGPFDKKSPAGGSEGYLDGGIGWYRKTFTLPDSARGRQVGILFDGAYMNSQVWLNGKLLGTRPCGYSSFYYDLTPCARFGSEKNVLSVRLNVEQPASRFYSGAGIERNVWLIITGPVHVATCGTYITTPTVTATGAEVAVQTRVRNDSPIRDDVTLTTRLLDPDGKEVGSGEASQAIGGGTDAVFNQRFSLPSARLWSPETPALYRAVNEIRVNGVPSDATTTRFGVRTCVFTRDKGFFLNGRRVEIKGVCDHHDLGCLGAVALRRGYERQLQILKSMGCNALRTSHNPPAPELLDLCDEMGFLVMDEAFDEWKEPKRTFGYGRFFDQWSDLDVSTMVDRDRNHPSIVIWSIGNEIPEGMKGAPGTARAASQRLVDDCHREDPSRPVTSACPAPQVAWSSGLAQALDLFGVNYDAAFYQENNPAPEKPHKPDAYAGQLPMIGSETASSISSRGEYGLSLDAQGNPQKNADPHFQVPAYGDYPPRFNNRAELFLRAVAGAPWVAGQFIWTGFDYLGEPAPYAWPSRSSYFGVLDLCGFPKDRFYLYQAQWGDKPVAHILPHWTWPGFEGKAIPVWVYTNADEVELFLNGQSLGVKHFPADTELVPAPPRAKKVTNATPFPPNGPMEPSLHLAWSVSYAPGVLKAVAKKDGRVVTTDEVRTTGTPASLQLTPDRTRIAADGQDLSFIKVAVLDKDGNVCPNADNEINFSLQGSAAELAGVDNGDATNHEAFQGTRHKAFHGLALAVLKSRYVLTGAVTVSASTAGLPTVTASVQVVAAGASGLKEPR